MNYSYHEKYEIDNAIIEAGRKEKDKNTEIATIRHIQKVLKRRAEYSEKNTRIIWYKLRKLEEKIEEVDRELIKHMHTLDNIAHKW